LRVELQDAQLSLTPFREHYEAIAELHGHIRRALNVLNGRPAEFEEPHAAPMSRGYCDGTDT
jgi:hypothetical protein